MSQPPLTPFRQALQQFNSPSINVRRRSGRLNRRMAVRDSVDLRSTKPPNSHRRLPTSLLAMESTCGEEEVSDKENEADYIESHNEIVMSKPSEQFDEIFDDTEMEISVSPDQVETHESDASAGAPEPRVSAYRWTLLLAVPLMIAFGAYFLAGLIYENQIAVSHFDEPPSTKSTPIVSSETLSAALKEVSEVALVSTQPDPVPSIPVHPSNQYQLYADYALISNGASVLFAETSPSFGQPPPIRGPDGFLSTFLRRLGIFLPPRNIGNAFVNSPNFVIYPAPSDPHANKCWKMKGDKGQLTVRLARRIVPTNFTLEHIKPSLALYGDMQDAPKQVEVFAYDFDEKKYSILGSAEYDISQGGPQRILVDQSVRIPTDTVQLRILSNSGNRDYTCLYKFRVHGEQP